MFGLKADNDFGSFADRRRSTIAEKDDKNMQKRRRLVISPLFHRKELEVNSFKFFMNKHWLSRQ